ncbi:hypothetical protein AMTRI_Chr04g245280 [Amborella trichopoda]
MALKHLEDFKLESIPDGLPLEHGRDVLSLCDATGKYFSSPFWDLVSKLNGSIQVPRLTAYSCAFWGFLHYHKLIERGIVTFKGLS